MTDQGFDPTYFEIVRDDVLAMIHEPVDRALEIGCGTGVTLKLLKDRKLVRWAAGVEIVPHAAARAQTICDALWQENIEQFLPPVDSGSLDLILALDVLEHLVDPWSVVDRLVPLLRPGGAMIASIPNLRNYKVVFPLLVRGKFSYDPRGGLLDQTHLRFFVQETAVELMSRSGLVVDRVEATGIKKHKLKWWLCAATGGALTGLYAHQFLIRSERRS